jgi:hypothetical protein
MFPPRTCCVDEWKRLKLVQCGEDTGGEYTDRRARAAWAEDTDLRRAGWLSWRTSSERRHNAPACRQYRGLSMTPRTAYSCRAEAGERRRRVGPAATLSFCSLVTTRCLLRARRSRHLDGLKHRRHDHDRAPTRRYLRRISPAALVPHRPPPLAVYLSGHTLIHVHRASHILHYNLPLLPSSARNPRWMINLARLVEDNSPGLSMRS